MKARQITQSSDREASYMSQFTDWWKPVTNHRTNKEPILRITFDTYEQDSVMRKCIIIIYKRGYQIWDINSPDDIFELYSYRSPHCETETIQIAKLLSNPHTEEHKGDKFFQNHPILMLSYNQPESSILTFSSLKKSYSHNISFKNTITQLQCNKRAIFVGTKKNIYILDSRSLRPITVFGGQHSLCKTVGSHFAVSSRWVAFACNENCTDITFNEPLSSLDVASDMYNRMASMATTVSTILPLRSTTDLQSSPIPPKSDGKTEEDNPGIIALYDTETDKIVCRIECHRNPIAYIAFDDSGTLLCTSSVAGTVFNVIRFDTQVNEACEEREILYRAILVGRLYRGRTCAKVVHISFSPDNKWIIVCTAHGTTHFFPISPCGEISVRTHASGEKNQFLLYPPLKEDQVPLVYALHRIKYPTGIIRSAAEINPVYSSAIVPSRIIVWINHLGCLVQYKYSGCDIDGKLAVDITLKNELDLGRTNNDKITCDYFTNLSSTHKRKRIPHWGAYGESTTINVNLFEGLILHNHRKYQILSERTYLTLFSPVQPLIDQSVNVKTDEPIKERFQRTHSDTECQQKDTGIPRKNLSVCAKPRSHTIEKKAVGGKDVQSAPWRANSAPNVNARKKDIKVQKKTQLTGTSTSVTPTKKSPLKSVPHQLVKRKSYSRLLSKNRAEATDAIDIALFCGGITHFASTTGNVREYKGKEGHQKMCAVLQERLRLIQLLKARAAEKDIHGILELVNSMKRKLIPTLRLTVELCVPMLDSTELTLGDINSLDSVLFNLLNSGDTQCIRISLNCLYHLVRTNKALILSRKACRSSLRTAKEFLEQDKYHRMSMAIFAEYKSSK